jgi:ABC-2 type transport system ATP-binding protein
MESVFRTHVERVQKDGATVLLSSHILSEVEQLCDRVTIVRAGKAVESGSLADLRHLTRTSVRVSTPMTLERVSALPGVHDARQDHELLAFDVDTDALQGVLAELTKAGIASLTVTPPSLEDLFLRHYGDPIVAEEAA